MSMWSRIANVFRGDRFEPRDRRRAASRTWRKRSRKGGTPPKPAGRLAPSLRNREESRDVRLIAWLDSLRADAVFGWRQLMKKKATSAAAVLSLALAIGACTSAFRLIDALLLRPLPVAHAERLYTVAFESPSLEGTYATYDSCSYPMFLQDARGAERASRIDRDLHV